MSVLPSGAAVEHDHAVTPVFFTGGMQVSPSGDMDGLANAVDGDAVRCGQYLDGGNAGHHTHVAFESAGFTHVVDDAERGVVKGGIPPDKECGGAILRNGVHQGVVKQLGAGLVPATDLGRVVAGVAVTGRVVNSDDGHLGGVGVHDELSELEQVGLDFAFVEGENGVGTLKRTDGFEGDVLRITCTYSYYSYVAHLYGLLDKKNLPFVGRFTVF